MTHSLFESKWTPPSVDQIVFNIDKIYVAGLFWRVVSPQLLERQSRIMSALAVMMEKLKASLPPDQSSKESRQRRYALSVNFSALSFIWLHRTVGSSSLLQARQESLISRHQRELRLFSEAIKRAEGKLLLELDPTVANIALVYNQLALSLQFWEDAKFWYGMPWWRNPRLDFPWAPSPLPQTLGHDPLERPRSAASSDSRRMVTFSEGEKSSSPKAPALTRVPRCSPPSNLEPSVFRPFRPRVKLVSV